ncbi:Uncharacterised protein [Vibrio cholerae]|nr:Uncharacterised protein [Vibrio cholerae]
MACNAVVLIAHKFTFTDSASWSVHSPAKI